MTQLTQPIACRRGAGAPLPYNRGPLMPMTHTFRVDGMHCASCSLLIDETLEDLPGVAASSTSVRNGRTIVELDTARTNPQQVIDTITGLGYRACPQP